VGATGNGVVDPNEVFIVLDAEVCFGGTIMQKISFKRSTPISISSIFSPSDMLLVSIDAVCGEKFSRPSKTTIPGNRRKGLVLSCPARAINDETVYESSERPTRLPMPRRRTNDIIQLE